MSQYAKNSSDFANLNSGLHSYYTSFTPPTITTNSSTKQVAMLPSIRLSLFEISGGSLSLSGVQYYYNQEKKLKDVRYKDISSNDDATYLDDYATLTSSQYLDKVFYNSDDTQVYTHYLIPDTTVILTFSLFLKPKNSAALTKPYNLQGIYNNVYHFMGNAEPNTKISVKVGSTTKTNVTTSNKDGSFTYGVRSDDLDLSSPGDVTVSGWVNDVYFYTGSDDSNKTSLKTGNFVNTTGENSAFYRNDYLYGGMNGVRFAYHLDQALSEKDLNTSTGQPITTPYVLYGTTTSPKWTD